LFNGPNFEILAATKNATKEGNKALKSFEIINP